MRATIGLLGLLCSTACGSSTPLASPPSPAVTSLTIAGQTLLTVGQATQLTATANMSDGTNPGVTNQTAWQSLNPGVATITATGLLTGIAVGSVRIAATYQGTSSTADATVQAALPSVAGNWRGAYTIVACNAFANLYGTVGPVICGQEFRIGSGQSMSLSLSQSGAAVTGSIYFNKGPSIAGAIALSGTVTRDGRLAWDTSVASPTGSYTAANGRAYEVFPGAVFTAVIDGPTLTISSWAFGFRLPGEDISYPPSGWVDLRPGAAVLTKAP